ncbi:MAG: hypothetical protein ACREE2_17810 [Stellaceae bacterium]
MKLFQIEEPDGSPSDPNLPGMAIAIDLSGGSALVAVSVGGNAALLDDREGFEGELPVPRGDADPAEWQELFSGARLRAERALARPATHAVVATAAAADRALEARMIEAAGRTGLELLRLVAVGDLPAGETPVLAAAILAEDLAPRPDPGQPPDANPG